MTFEKLLHADAIRLVRLHPGLPRDALRGEVITARLGEKPSFEAISYRYSDPDKQHPESLRCENRGLYVGNNLADALRQFRHKVEKRTIWVDQLCIRQDDEDEKFQQLQIFGEIFLQARKVLIWLGKGDSTTERAMTLFEKMNQDLQKIDEMHHDPAATAVDYFASRSSDAQLLKDLFTEDWFTRLWTLQEAALARAAEMWIGDKTLPFDQFLYFFRRADGDRRGHWANAVQAINTGLGGDDPDNPTRNSFQAISTIAKLKQADRLPPIRVLNIVRALDCKEQIDRVWSLLRFFPEDYVASLRPFRKAHDASHLYAAIARFSLEHGKIEWLSAAGLTLQRKSYPSDLNARIQAVDINTASKADNIPRPELTLPSWVPDWTFTVRVHALWTLNADCMEKTGRPLYRAGGLVPDSLKVSFSDDGKVLHVRVKLLQDRVGDLRPPFKIPTIPKGTESRPDLTKYGKDAFEKLDDQMDECFKLASECTGEVTSSNAEFACKAALVGSMVSDDISSTAAGTLIRATNAQIDLMFHNYQLSRKVLRWISGAQSNPPAVQTPTSFAAACEDLAQFQQMSMNNPVCDGIKIKPNYVGSAFPEMCKARRFFVTDTRRYLGIAPDITQPGDRICVIPGCCAPFIIRPSGDHWQIVGECYVHGIMDGEVIEDQSIPLVPIRVI